MIIIIVVIFFWMTWSYNSEYNYTPGDGYPLNYIEGLRN